MYKNIFAITVSLTIAIAPWAASAAATFSSISTATDSSIASATTTHTITFTTTEEIASAQKIALKYYDATNLFHNGFDFSGATLTAGSGLPATLMLAQDSFGYSSPQLTLTSAMSAGTYSFTIANIVNTSTIGEYKPGMQIMAPGIPSVVQGSSFTIGAENDSEDVPENQGTNSVATVSVTPTSFVAENVTTVEISFVMRLSAAASSDLNIAFLNSAGTQVPFLTTDTTFSSDDFTATLIKDDIGDLWRIVLGSALAQRSAAYTFTLSNVTNPALGTDNTYTFVMSTFALEDGGYAESAAFTITETDEETDESPSASFDAPTSLSVKKNKKSLSVLRWNAVEDAIHYSVKFMRGKGKRIATWKNIMTTKKVVPKKFIKAGKKYAFKVKACDASGCSAWSASKAFHPKLTDV